MYEKCSCEENDQDHLIIIFDKSEPIKITVDPKSFMPQDPNMIHMVTDNANPNASQHLSKDTFILHDVTCLIDDQPPTKPQTNLSQQ